MKIEAFTNNPEQLINAINKGIKDGDLKTWKQVQNNKNETLYSHTPDQWADKALMMPSALKDRARFSIAWWVSKEDPSPEIKGYIIGRFTEILMVHFRNYFTKLETSL
jgi:hypothetical protein